MKNLLFILLLAVALGAGWFLGHHQKTAPMLATTTAPKPLYYQSPMHPWIKSDKPGKCTICGMDLVPIYQEKPGAASINGGLTLGQGSVSTAALATAPVLRQPLRRTIRVSGMIDDDETKHRYISAYLAGRIDHLDVDYLGAEVVQGQSLGTFYSPELLVAEREYLALQSSAASAGVDSLLAAGRTRLQRLGLTSAQIDRLRSDTVADSTSIVAPISGTVIEREAYAGQYVQAGEKLFTLADFSVMWFQFDAYEQDLPWLRPGQPITVTPEGRQGMADDATLTFINPTLDETTRSAKVRVELPNPLIVENGQKHRALLHKLYATGQIAVTSDPVLTLPRQAVLRTDDQPLVYVETQPGSYIARPVKLGRRGDDAWEILSGLAENERVVTSGNLLLDAQAQLSQEAAPLKMDQSKATSALTPGQLAALIDPLDVAASALADGDLGKFRLAEQEIVRITAPAGLASPPTVFSGSELKAARAHFASYSTGLSDLILADAQSSPQVQVYECFMATDAGAGRWLQKSGPLRNPFLPTMPTCGKEIKP